MWVSVKEVWSWSDFLFVWMFSTLSRLVYWVSLNVCSTWRGFGSGLTVFPLLGMVAFNLYLLYSLNLKMPLLGSQDVLYNQVTPTSWSGETSQSSGGTPHILDAQWGGELRFLLRLSEEEIFSENRSFLWSAAEHSNTCCSYNLQISDGLTLYLLPLLFGRTFFFNYYYYYCGFMPIIWNARALSLLLAADALEQCCSLKTCVFWSYFSAYI